MKLSVCLIALAFATSLFATAPQPGPWLYKEVGDPKYDPSWVECLIVPGVTTLRHYVNGKAQPATQTKNAVTIAVAKPIQAAAKAPLGHAVHVLAKIPPVHLRAGVFPQVGAFTLFLDSGALDIRQGQDAADLVALTNSLCGQLKPSGQPRE